VKKITVTGCPLCRQPESLAGLHLFSNHEDSATGKGRHSLHVDCPTPVSKLRELLGLEADSLMIKNCNLKRFGHIERNDDNKVKRDVGG